MTEKYLEAKLSLSGAEYTWRFGLSGTLKSPNVKLECLVPLKNGRFRRYGLKGYTEQPLPHPTLYCDYRLQLYDVLGQLLSNLFNTPGITILFLSPILGEPIYVTE